MKSSRLVLIAPALYCALVLSACSGAQNSALPRSSAIDGTPKSSPISASNASIAYFTLPDGIGSADDGNQGIVATPDGSIWFSAESIGKTYIGKMTPDGSFTMFPLPPIAGAEPAFDWVGPIVVGSDGALWFARKTDFAGDPNHGFIARLTTDGGYRQYDLGPGNTEALALTRGSDGAIWFTMAGVNQIGRINPSGDYTTYQLSEAPTWQEMSITAGTDGALWFTERDHDKIGRITTAGEITEYPLAAGTFPYAITSAPDGTLWFLENGTQAMTTAFGRMTTSGQTQASIQAPQGPRAFTIAPSGVPYYTALGATQGVGCVAGDSASSACFVSQSKPLQAMGGGQITLGPDANLYFNYGTQIGRVPQFTP